MLDVVVLAVTASNFKNLRSTLNRDSNPPPSSETEVTDVGFTSITHRR